jgi:hypothetical protein
MINKFLCLLFGHKYVATIIFSSHARKIRCKCCMKAWAMNDDVQILLPWDSELAELYGCELRA